jgi:hypothetical protein
VTNVSGDGETALGGTEEEDEVSSDGGTMAAGVDGGVDRTTAEKALVGLPPPFCVAAARRDDSDDVCCCWDACSCMTYSWYEVCIREHARYSPLVISLSTLFFDRRDLFRHITHSKRSDLFLLINTDL